MALGAQLPIRLDPETDKRLQAVANRTGTTKSALIRHLAKTFVDQCVKPDGTVALPINWEDLLPRADARSVTLRAAEEAAPNTSAPKDNGRKGVSYAKGKKKRKP